MTKILIMVYNWVFCHPPYILQITSCSTDQLLQWPQDNENTQCLATAEIMKISSFFTCGKKLLLNQRLIWHFRNQKRWCLSVANRSRIYFQQTCDLKKLIRKINQNKNKHNLEKRSRESSDVFFLQKKTPNTNPPFSQLSTFSLRGWIQSKSQTLGLLICSGQNHLSCVLEDDGSPRWMGSSGCNITPHVFSVLKTHRRDMNHESYWLVKDGIQKYWFMKSSRNIAGYQYFTLSSPEKKKKTATRGFYNHRSWGLTMVIHHLQVLGWSLRKCAKNH